MANPRLGQHTRLGTIVMGLVLVSSGISTLFAQGPANYGAASPYGPPMPQNSVWGGHDPSFAGMPAYDPAIMYDQALMAAGYQVDPGAANFAAWSHYQEPMGYGPTAQMAGFQQAAGGYPAMQQQPYYMDHGANPFRQTSLADDILGDAEGQDQSVPTLNYSGGTDAQYSVFARPDPYNPSGGARFTHRTPSWLKNFEAGVYANDDQAVLTAGGVLSLWEGTYGTLAMRALGTSIYHSNGPSKIGAVLDMWYARRMYLLGSQHFIKVGGFWDTQDVFQRYGVTVGGILFADVADLPPTFDVAIGHGTGAAVLGNQYREVADVDVQCRVGFVLHPRVRCGATIQIWQWENPVLEDSITSVGGYAQFDLGPFLVNFDVTSGKNDWRGFLNLTWEPGRLWNRVRGCDTVTVASTDAKARYHAWLSQPVMRDLAFRTGDPAVQRQQQQQQAVAAFPLTVSCIVRLNDEVTADGLLEADESFDVDFLFTNNQAQAVQNVTVQGDNADTTVTLTGTAPATQMGALGTTAVNVPGNSMAQTLAAEALNVQIDAAATAGETVFFDFEVVADGRTARFRCGPVTVGQGAPAQQQALFLFEIP